MYKLCQSEKSYQRQRELERGLLKLMLKRDYADITVSEFCDFMDIPRKSFYRYFASKDGALYALIDHTIADFFETPLPATKSRGSALSDLDVYFIFWHRQKELLDALKRSSLTGILVERANNFALTGRHFPDQFTALSADTRTLAISFCVSGLMAMILYWHSQDFRLSPEEMTKCSLDILTHPLLRR